MFSQKCLDCNPYEATQVLRAVAHYKSQQTERIDSMSAEETKMIRSLRGMLELGQACKSDIELLAELGNTLPYEAAVMKATASLVVFFMDKKEVAVDWTDTELPCDPKDFARLLKFVVESEDHPFNLVFKLPKHYWFNGKVLEAEYNKLKKYGTGDARATYKNDVLTVSKTLGTGVITVRQFNYPPLPDITICTLGNTGNAVLLGKFLSTQKSAQKIRCSAEFLDNIRRSLVRCVVESAYLNYTAAGMTYGIVGQDLCIEPSLAAGLTYLKEPLVPLLAVDPNLRVTERVDSKELVHPRDEGEKQRVKVTDKKNITGKPCGRCGVVNKEGRVQCFRCRAAV